MNVSGVAGQVTDIKGEGKRHEVEQALRGVQPLSGIGPDLCPKQGKQVGGACPYHRYEQQLKARCCAQAQEAATEADGERVQEGNGGKEEEKFQGRSSEGQRLADRQEAAAQQQPEGRPPVVVQPEKQGGAAFRWPPLLRQSHIPVGRHRSPSGQGSRTIVRQTLQHLSELHPCPGTQAHQNVTVNKGIRQAVGRK